MRILGLGDNNVDLNQGSGLYYPGGNCVNVAVFTAQEGARASYVGVFGDDALGRELRAAIEREGVDTALCEVRPGPTGLSEFIVDAGERRFVRTNRGGVIRDAPLRPSPAVLALAGSSDVVHSSVYSNIADLEAVRAVAPILSYDFSSEAEYRDPAYRASMAPLLDVALFSCADLPESERMLMLAETAEAGVPFVIGTLGAGGATVRHGELLVHVDAVPVPASAIMDSMGCGDAFVSAFLTELVGAGWHRGDLIGRDLLVRMTTAGIARATEQLAVNGAFDRPFEADGNRSGADEYFPPARTS